MTRSDGRVRDRGSRTAAFRARLLVGACLLVVAAQLPAQERAAPLRRAYVPLDRPEAWPAGDWAPVPTDVLKSYLLDHSTPGGAVRPLPYLARAEFEAALAPDLALHGSFTASIVRPPGAGDFLELGPVTPVMSDLAWPDGPALWGTDEDARVLLAVPSAPQPLTGRWSLSGQSLFDRVRFHLRLPPAESTRCRITTPASWRLTSSAGIVSGPEPAPAAAGETRPGAQVVWTLELGRQPECTWFLEPAADDSSPVSLQCDRTLAYTVRPRGCRVQADFVVQSLAAPPGELVFRAPAGLTNLSATYSSANVPLRFQAAPEGADLRISVPLHLRDRGRLGSFRIAGELPAVEGGDWPLPPISLESAVVVRGTRRVSVDRPLTLMNVHSDGLRESAVNSDDLGASWHFEELRPAGTLTVRIGRPQTLLTAAVATSLWAEAHGTLFHAVANLDVRAGSTFDVAFDLPPGWEVIDVAASAGASGSGISSWSVRPSDGNPRLHVEFRQALQAQSSKQIEILGRATQLPDAERRVPALPIPVNADRWELLLAVRPGPGRTVRGTSGLIPVEIDSAGLDPGQLSQLSVLGLSTAEPQRTWFRADSVSGGGELVLGPAAAESRTTPAISPDASAALENAAAAPLSLTLALQSILADSAHLHAARYRLSGAPSRGPLEFRLDPEAHLDAVLVDGMGHVTSVRDSVIELAPLPPAAREVQVRYRTSAASRVTRLRRQLQVPLPRWNVPVAGLHWRIHLPPGQAVLDSSLPSAVWSPDGTLSWSQRLFAPLARHPDSPRFQPWSQNDWRGLTLATWDSDRGSAGPVDEQVIASAGRLPAELRLELWNVRETASLGRAALFAALILVAGLRRRGGRRWGLAATTGAVATALVSLAAPACYAPIAGGCFTGIFVGMLLPASWIARRDVLADWSVPREGSSLRVARPAGVAGLALALLIGEPPARSQEASRPELGDRDRSTVAPTPHPADQEPGASDATTPVSQASGVPFDVLMPYTDTGAGPVGYLARTRLDGFRDWFRARRVQPAYLLRSAHYYPDAADPAAIRAELGLIVFAAAGRVPVQLSFRDAVLRNPDDCLVDGRREQVRPAAAGDGLIVEVDGAAPPVAGEPPDVPGGESSPPARSTTLTLWLRSAHSDASIPGEWSLTIPRVVDSHVVFSGQDPRRLTESARGTRSHDRRDDSYALGWTDRLRLSVPPEAESTATGSPEISVQAVSMIEVHPLRMQVQSELLLSASSASRLLPRRLQLQLPRGAEVRQVAAEGLRGFTTWHAEPHATLLEVEFEHAPEPGQTLQFDYTAPLSEAGLRVEIPSIPLLPDGALLSHRIGLRAAPGLLLEPDRTALPSGRVQELLPDLFTAGLSSGTVWPAADAAFSVPRAMPLPVQLSLLHPSRGVALQQTMAIERTALRLEAVAQVDVSGGRVYRHEFLVPPELRIDSVSAVQDGANRLRDWVRHDDLVVLHLQDGRSGLQEIRVAGWMPLHRDAPTPLPYLALRDANVRLSELLLRNGSGEPVVLTSHDGTPLEPGFDAPRSATDPDDGEVRRYLGGSDFPATCRVLPRRSFTRLAALTRLVQSGNGWAQATACRVLDRVPGREYLEVGIPPSFGQDFQIRPEQQAAASRPAPDGSLELFVHLSDSDAAPSDVEISAPVRIAGAPPWDVRVPAFPRATYLARYLALPADAPFAPQGAERVEAARIDADTRAWWQQLGVLDTDAVYRLDDETIHLIEASYRMSGASAVSLLETLIHSDPGATTHGRTTIFLSGARGGDEFQLALPTGATLLQTDSGTLSLDIRVVDGHTVVGKRPAGARRASGRVVVDWQRPADAALHVEEPFPRLAGTAPVREFVVVVPPRRADYLPRHAPSRLDREVYLLERSEQLLELIGGHADVAGELPASLLEDLTRDLDGQLRTLSGVSWGSPALRRQYERACARWDSLRAADWIAAVAAESDADASREQFSTALLAAERAVVLQPAAAASPVATFWRVDRRQARLAISAALLAGLWLGWATLAFARRRVPLHQPADATRPAFAGLMLLGLIWWLWLMWSPCGLILFAAGGLLQVARLARARATGPGPAG